MSRVALSLAAVLVALLGAQSAPAEAGKIGNLVVKTATKAAVKSALKGGKKDRGEKDDNDEVPARSSFDRQSVSGDAEARAAHAKAKLAEEGTSTAAVPDPAPSTQTQIMAGASDMTPGINAGIVCLAGCN